VPDNQQTQQSPGFAPLSSLSRRDAVIREIRRAIVTGALQPGEKLTENRLAASLDVSRPTMREAVAQLSQEGLLIQEPYRGLRVADLDPAAIMDIARARVALDMLAADEILADPTGRRLDMVRQAWAQYERLPLDVGPVEAHEAHVAFHRNLWVASENTMLLRFWAVTEAHLTVVLAYDQVTRDDPHRAHEVHERLVEAILAGKRKDILRAVNEHTIDSAQVIADLLRAASSTAAG
jgi:DNA-binding GntR family transcriptional regulator